jgi:hypothetical protein
VSLVFWTVLVAALLCLLFCAVLPDRGQSKPTRS